MATISDPYVEELIRNLLRIYKLSGNQLRAVLLAADSTSFERFRAGDLLRQIDAQVAALNAVALDISQKGVPVAYRRGQDLTTEQIRLMGLRGAVDLGSRIHVTAVSAIADQMSLDLLNGNASMGTMLKQWIRRTQQTVISEGSINQAIGGGLIEGRARREVSDQILKDLRQHLQEGQLLTAGSRTFKPEDYAELVARTRTREATTQGAINSGLELDLDLFQVSVHQNPCDICKGYQGKIYSYSGKSPDFPKLTNRPPFHPRCRHTLIALSEEYLERKGQYAALSKLSKDEDASVSDNADYQAYLARNKPPQKEFRSSGKPPRKPPAPPKTAASAPEPEPNPFPLSNLDKPTADLLTRERERLRQVGPPINQATVLAANVATFAFAQRLGHDAAWVEARTAAMQAHVDNSQVYMRVRDDALQGMIADGRYKTQFETGTSGGLLDPGRRDDAEYELFGLRDPNPIVRPAYGYLGESSPLGQSELDYYGKIVIELKPETRGRTTITLGDSLDVEHEGRTASAFFDLQPGSLERGTSSISRIEDIRPYAEAQIHGGITLDDVERVLLYERETNGIVRKLYDEETRRILEQKGLKVEIVRLP